MRLIPKNWRKFQHYKDRNPPWIKLERRLLDDRDFMRLPVASRALAPCLWLLASESHDGSFKADLEELGFRLRLPTNEIIAGLKPLIEQGFFLDASTMLAPCLRDAVPETETEAYTTETEQIKEKHTKEKPARVARSGMPEFLAEGFENFWKGYDKKVDRQDCERIWAKINPSPELIAQIYVAACQYRAATPDKQFRKHPSTWLNGKCWENEIIDRRVSLQPTNRPPAYAAGLAIFGNIEEKRNERIIDITPPTRLLGAEDL